MKITILTGKQVGAIERRRYDIVGGPSHPTPLWGNGRIYVDTTGTARTMHGDVIQDHDIQDLAKALHAALESK